MCKITIFTTRLEDKPIPFGGDNICQPINNNERLTEVLLSAFKDDFNNDIIKQIWNGVCDEGKKNAIRKTWQFKKDIQYKSRESSIHLHDIVNIGKSIWKRIYPGEKKENICKNELDNEAISNALCNDLGIVEENIDYLMQIWDKEKKILLNKSTSQGFWSVYPAIKKYSGVYALNILTRPRSIMNWTEALVDIAKAIAPQATTINLVLHDKDFGISTEHKVYTIEELHKAYGGKDEFEDFMKSKKIATLNVIIFQHSNHTTVYKRLLHNEDLGDVHSEVEKIIIEGRDIQRQVQAQGLSKDISSKFELKRQATVKEMKEKDPIGMAYSHKQFDKKI